MSETLLQAELFAPAGHDPLGEAYARAHLPEERRASGITLTPQWLVQRMLDLAATRDGFDTVVDCGAGSGRFAIAAALRFPHARVIAVEAHPEMAALLRRRLRDEALSHRVELLEADYRQAGLPARGRTLFVGNPPYVRHHDLEPQWKEWYRRTMAAHGIVASQLAGLHAQFMLRTVELMRDGDAMLFVTAAEWLDNGYGQAVRDLLGGAGDVALRSLWLAAPDESVFPDALVSSVVVEAQRGGGDAAVQTGMIAGRALHPVRRLDRASLRAAQRWTPLCREQPIAIAGGAELGELFRITRGQVTGLNSAWVVKPEDAMPATLTVPAITRAREIIDDLAATREGVARLARVVDLPSDLDALASPEREAALRFVDRARALGADRSYIARHRTPWYRVGMREPPAAFVSYMGRRPPVFRANPQRVSFLNIAHGLYPRAPMAEVVLSRILQHLNTTTDLYSGRVYGGGLAKFEPSDIARLRVPRELLESVA